MRRRYFVRIAGIGSAMAAAIDLATRNTNYWHAVAFGIVCPVAVAAALYLKDRP